MKPTADSANIVSQGLLAAADAERYAATTWVMIQPGNSATWHSPQIIEFS
jgi:hypothetical protein